MNKKILIFLSLLLIAAFTAGCTVPGTSSGDKIRVVTTIFPEYDWVRQIAGENSDHIELTLLLDNGVDLHSYQPTADDMVKIYTCDMFIYVGGESDAWVKDALAGIDGKNTVVINLLQVLGDKVKEEELVEGMQEEEEEGEEDEPEYDEHVWLSLRHAAELCKYISSKLCDIDVKNKDIYTANTEAYVKKLTELDEKYEEAVDAASIKTVLFGDRFPFRYLADDYGLEYYAAFAGCSAESEASFETVVFLANKLDELGLKAILQIESSDGKLANTVRQTTKSKDQTILTMNSLQSTSAEDVKNGATYLDAMEQNLSVLKNALN